MLHAIALFLSVLLSCRAFAQALPEARVSGFRDQVMTAPHGGVIAQVPKPHSSYGPGEDATNLLILRSAETEAWLATHTRQLAQMQAAINGHVPEGESEDDSEGILRKANPLLRQYLNRNVPYRLDLSEAASHTEPDVFNSSFFLKYPELRALALGDEALSIARAEYIVDRLADQNRISVNPNFVFGRRPDSLELYLSTDSSESAFINVVTDGAEPECEKIDRFWSDTRRFGVMTAQMQRVLAFLRRYKIRDRDDLIEKADKDCRALKDDFRQKTAKPNETIVYRGSVFHEVVVHKRRLGQTTVSSNPYSARFDEIELDVAETYLTSPPLDDKDARQQEDRAFRVWKRAVSEEVQRQLRELYELRAQISAASLSYADGRIESKQNWILRSILPKVGETVVVGQQLMTGRVRDYVQTSLVFTSAEFRDFATAEGTGPLHLLTPGTSGCAGASTPIELEGELINIDFRMDNTTQVQLALAPHKPGATVCNGKSQVHFGELEYGTPIPLQYASSR